MADEGHIVGNHTWHHPDLTQLDMESLEEELTDVEDAYREATGRDMPKYLRPPPGPLQQRQPAADEGPGL